MELAKILEMIESKSTQIRENSRKIIEINDSVRALNLPSNNELRKAYKANFKEKLEEKEQILLPYKEEIEKLKEINESLKNEISELENTNEYKLHVWEHEKEDFLKQIDDEMKEHLDEQGFSLDFLIQKAPFSQLAKEILINYTSPTYGRGYVGYSLSANAWEAQENRQKPISKWNKQDLEDFNSLFGTKTTLKKLKEFLVAFGEAGYHHTSKFYNESKHYSIPVAILNSTKQDFENYFGEVKFF